MVMPETTVLPALRSRRLARLMFKTRIRTITQCIIYIHTHIQVRTYAMNMVPQNIAFSCIHMAFCEGTMVGIVTK